MTYNASIEVTSSYWSVGTFHDASSRNLTVLTASHQLSNIYTSPVTYYQNVYDGINNATGEATSSILNFGFSKPKIPFSINDNGGPRPGDYIRFEYNPNQVYNIKKIGVVSDPLSPYLGNLTLSVFPPPPSTVNLNHFNIYRIINDGSSLILNVEQPETGSSFAGLIYPQFRSTKLQQSASMIVQDLTSKGVIS
jgi:hypothetical protein